MKKLLIVLFGVLAFSVGSAQADWIKHEGHGVEGPGYNIPKVYFNQVKHGDLDGLVAHCKGECEFGPDKGICGGFVVTYTNTNRTTPGFCNFAKEDATPDPQATADFYQAVTHDEVLGLLEQLISNLNPDEILALSKQLDSKNTEADNELRISSTETAQDDTDPNTDRSEYLHQFEWKSYIADGTPYYCVGRDTIVGPESKGYRAYYSQDVETCERQSECHEAGDGMIFIATESPLIGRW